MKRPLAIIIFSSLAIFAGSRIARAASIVKLPYAKGQSFVVTQGYDTPPTHIKKDSYALDFTQDDCDAYGKAVVAAASGTAMFVREEGYNGGYGTELIIDHGNRIVSRYAHMIPGSITAAVGGAPIRQGETIGLVGDTGLVAGAACADHPGTHIHFAMDTVNADGTFSAYDPEPISGYIDMTEGKWYLSDNAEEDAVADAATDTVAPPTSSVSGEVLGAYDVATATTAASGTSVATSAIPVVVSAPPSPPVVAGGGGGAVYVPGAPAGTVDDATTTPADATSAAQTPSSTPTSSPPAAASSGVLFEQSDDSANSPYSFYDDNWFELGNGFSGMLNALTLEGRVSDSQYLSSHVSLQEFKDKNYTAMVQSFPISDDAPFTHVTATATFSGLSILLKPYFYYRLATIQDWQNRCVILLGTATTTVGVAMGDNFIYGTGGVQTTSTFFPFMEMDGIIATSTLVPPAITPPGDITAAFDELNSQVTPSWSTSTDPDWPENPLHYEMNYSTSTSLSDTGWTDPGSFPVVTGNTYLIGIRAVDNYGDVSAAATATWNFPPGFTPYTLSPGLGYAYQYFTVPATSTLRSITLFSTNFTTGARNPWAPGCGLQLFDEYDMSSLGMTPADNGYNGFDCAGTPTFSFASSSPVLYPDHLYHWAFTVGGGVQFYGTQANTAGGLFSDPSLINAKFTVTGDTGVLFSN